MRIHQIKNESQDRKRILMTDHGSRNGKKKMVKSSQDLILESSKDFDNHKIQFDKIGLQNHLVNNNDHQIIMQPMNIGGMDEFE